jgi:hypothetical protein
VLARENPVDGNGDPKPSLMRGSRDRFEAVGSERVAESGAFREDMEYSVPERNGKCQGYLRSRGAIWVEKER